MNQNEHPQESTDWPIISRYTQDEAIQDEVLLEIGRFNTGKRIVFTSNLYFSGKFQDTQKRIDLIKQAIALLKEHDPEDTEYMKLRVIEKDRIWVIQNSEGLTFLRPEDY